MVVVVAVIVVVVGVVVVVVAVAVVVVLVSLTRRYVVGGCSHGETSRIRNATSKSSTLLIYNVA